MTPLAEVALRTTLAAAGIGLLGAAGAAAGRARGRGALPAAPRLPVRILIGVARTLAPVARRSELLRRPASEARLRRWLALTAGCSWVAGAAAAVADRASTAARHRDTGLDGSPGTRTGPAALEAMAALRAACSLVASVPALAVAAALGGVAGAVALAGAIGAALLPDAVLGIHARRAARSVDVAMPGALELLAACCRGGVALEAALGLTAAHVANPLRGVLDRARRRQRAGEAPATALRLEAEAVGVDEVGGLGRLVDRHHQLGLPLEAPLLARAEAARARARVATLARAGRGVPMASLLLATVIAPCCVGILATWVVLAAVGQAGAG